VLKQALTDNDRIILDRLLSKLTGSVHGAVDSWTLVCLGEFHMNRRDFILKQTDIMKALVTVTRTVLAEANLGYKEPISGQLNNLSAACQKLEDAFLVLAECRSISREEIGAAVQALTGVYAELPEVIRQLGQATSCPISFWNDWTPQREAYYQGILDRLFDQFSQVRQSEQAAGTAAPNT
jgi:hypothetical protein